MFATVPNKPLRLECNEGRHTITIDIIKGAGHVDKFSLKCTNCSNDTSRQVEDTNHEWPYSNLDPYTYYHFVATAIAGELESANHKESSTTEKTCQTNEGRKYQFHCLISMGISQQF